MFIFEILIYVAFAWVMYHLAKESYRVSYPLGCVKFDTYLWLFIAFYTVVCGIRWNVGVDSWSYAMIFKNGDQRSLENANGEWLFSWVANTISESGLHYTFGLGLCAIVQIFFIAKAVKEYRYILIALPFVLFGNRYFVDLNNGVRQMMVACMFLYASRFIVDRKPLHYAAFILIGSTIHQSVLMLIPFYFLTYLPKLIDIAQKRWVLLGIFVLCFVAGQTPAFQNIANTASEMAIFMGYNGYAERASDFLSNDYNEEALAFGPMMLSYFVVAVLAIWYGPQIKCKYDHHIPYLNLWYFLGYLYACSYFLVCNVSHIFLRPVQYFELFQMLIFSLLLYDVAFSKYRKFTQALMLFIILWTSISWDLFKATGLPMEYSTYKVFFVRPVWC